MAKKFGKFLLFTATVGAAAAAVAYYLQKKELFSSADHDGDDDYDDFSNDPDEEDTSRSYVQLTPGNGQEADTPVAESSAAETADSTAEEGFTPLVENAPKAEETVEEFFDEDDTDEATLPGDNQ